MHQTTTSISNTNAPSHTCRHTTAQGQPPQRDIYIARQPIHDRQRQVTAYEMLFRSSRSNHAGVEDDGLATAQVMINIMVEMGFDALLGSKHAFINFPREFLLQNYAHVLPPERVVVEILEDVIVDDDLLRAVSALSAAGYTIALDDFVFHDHLEPLVALADIIKIDLRTLDRDALAAHVTRLRQYRVRLLAEKVETHEEHAYCMELGFDYFQGYFFCRPEVLNGQRSSTDRLTIVNLLSALHDPNVTYEQIDTLVGRDVTLGYKILKLVNSAYYGLPNPITTLRQALLLLGINTIRTWATLLMLAQIDDKPHELISLALHRAWMCRCLGRAMHLAGQEESLFLVGLFSVLDALLDCPLPEALQTIPLSDAVVEALLTHGGNLGAALRCVLAYEQGDWHTVHAFGIDSGMLTEAYLDAVRKATDMYQALS